MIVGIEGIIAGETRRPVKASLLIKLFAFALIGTSIVVTFLLVTSTVAMNLALAIGIVLEHVFW